MNVELSSRPARNLPELPDSAPLLVDHASLRARWEQDGVLYFRNVTDKAAIATVRAEYIARLKELGAVAEGETQPLWSGLNRLDGKLAHPISDSIWRGLVAAPSFDAVVRSFLGEAPAWVPIVVHRAAPPADRAKMSGDDYQARHQDRVFNYGIDFITCWVPLMDIDDTVGGLAAVPGSHKGSLYPAEDAGRRPGRPNGIPAGTIADTAWRRPNYKAGDLLMFHSMTAHAGLPNRSDMMRLSVDIRFLPGSLPKPIVGLLTNVDGEKVRLKTETGEDLEFVIDANTIVRGPKGTALEGDERAGVLFRGANVIAVPDTAGRAKLVRSVSRKYIDLPANWFVELPANWVS